MLTERSNDLLAVVEITGGALIDDLVTTDGSLPPNMADGSVFGDGGAGRPCPAFAEKLAAYLDRELNPQDRKTVESHLNDCPQCAAELAALREIDQTLRREWRDNAPLPSSLEHKRAVDQIMAALPEPAPQTEPFARKRVHTRARWTRLSTGLAGIAGALALLWSGYSAGYARGRLSAALASPAPGRIHPVYPPVTPVSFDSSSASTSPSRRALHPPPLER